MIHSLKDESFSQMRVWGEEGGRGHGSKEKQSQGVVLLLPKATEATGSGSEIKTEREGGEGGDMRVMMWL